MIMTHYRVTASFEKYGSDVLITKSDGSVSKTKGVLQTISYKNSNNYELENCDISSVRNMRYMLMARYDADIVEGDVLSCNDSFFRVLVSQKYIVGNNCIYRWAILKTYEKPQEDDFSA